MTFQVQYKSGRRFLSNCKSELWKISHEHPRGRNIDNFARSYIPITHFLTISAPTESHILISDFCNNYMIETYTRAHLDPEIPCFKIYGVLVGKGMKQTRFKPFLNMCSLYII